MIDVTLHQLRVFREVAAKGTMAAAAESLGYTPSAISQAMAAMEKTLGHEVVERAGRNVQLTDLGRELLVHAEELLAGVERASVQLERAVSEPRGRFVMGVFESFALTVLPKLLHQMQHEHPDLAVHTREATIEYESEVLRGSLDMAFYCAYPHAPVPLPAGLTSRLILTERFWLVVPQGHELAPGPVALPRLEEFSLISPPPEMGCGRCVFLACRGAGFEPDIQHQIDDYTSAIRMVEAGLGIAMIPDLGLVDLRGDVEVLALEQVVNRQVVAVYRKSSAGRPALTAVLDAATSIAEDVGAYEAAALTG